MGIARTAFFQRRAPDPTLGLCPGGRRGHDDSTSEPDVIIAVGGGSAMDAGKDHVGACMSIRRRILWIWPCALWISASGVYTFPKMGEKAYFIAVPTTAGTGSEVTPFAVITDETIRRKIPVRPIYELMPNMAIVDADHHDERAKRD